MNDFNTLGLSSKKQYVGIPSKNANFALVVVDTENTAGLTLYPTWGSRPGRPLKATNGLQNNRLSHLYSFFFLFFISFSLTFFLSFLLSFSFPNHELCVSGDIAISPWLLRCQMINFRSFDQLTVSAVVEAEVM